ncbi:hypothetical protein [Actinocorallia libanotica]|uniref:Uncharacterized protein n=1 Tax=Actinocorallia libanotica TaxID=46162 RepID=A0ABP4B4P7_9ACTN
METVFTFEVPEGTVNVVILAATLEQGHSREKGARIEITTDTFGESGREPGFLKIRGRRYRLKQRFQFATSRWGDGPYWRTEHDGYNTGYWNDKGQPVGYETAARTRLYAIELEIREQFEADQPEWQAVSTVLGLRDELHGEEKVISRLEAEIETRTARMSKLVEQITSLGQPIFELS